MSKSDAPAEFQAGNWTVKVTKFESSTFNLTLESAGSVTGRRTVGDVGGSVSGSWAYQRPMLTLDLSSRLGLHPQPVRYEIDISGGDDSCLTGSDSDGHNFHLKRN